MYMSKLIMDKLERNTDEQVI